MKLVVKPGEIPTIHVNFNPIRRGRTSCDIKLSILNNPYEYFAVTDKFILIMAMLDTSLRFRSVFWSAIFLEFRI